jgi:hypothetical protein
LSYRWRAHFFAALALPAATAARRQTLPLKFGEGLGGGAKYAYQ